MIFRSFFSEVPDLLKGASQCFLRSLPLDRNYGYVTCAFDQSQVSLAGVRGSV